MQSANLVCLTPTSWVDPTKVESVKLLNVDELWQSFDEDTTHVIELTMQSGAQEFFTFTNLPEANTMLLSLIAKLQLMGELDNVISNTRRHNCT